MCVFFQCHSKIPYRSSFERQRIRSFQFWIPFNMSNWNSRRVSSRPNFFLKKKFVKLTVWILIMDFRQKPEPLRPRHQHLLSFSRSERRNPRPLVAPHSILSSGETEAWKMSNARYIVEGLIIPQISLVGLVGNTLTIIVLNHNDVKLKRSLVDVLCGLATFDNLFLLSIFPMFTMPSLSDW